MARTVTVSLGPHYEAFIQASIEGGRYNNASEVVRAALRRLEEDEARLAAIRAALIEGEESGQVGQFNPEAFVKRLNSASPPPKVTSISHAAGSVPSAGASPSRSP